MKLARFFCKFVILGMLAVVANAQTPVDPKVIINKFALDPTCADNPAPATICYTGDGSSSEPLIEDYQHLKPFIYEPADHDAHLDQLYLAFASGTIPFPTILTCGGSNIWANCGQVSPANPFDALFLFSGPGFLVFDEGGTVSLQPDVSAIPEPGTYLLFGTGLIAIFSVAKRRLAARPAVI